MAKAKTETSKWELKDRTYFLKGGKSPLTYTIKSKGIFFFDEQKAEERELKYAINQKTPFVDEFAGNARLGHIVFEDGTITVPKEKQSLQKLLSLYHPDRNKIYQEFDPLSVAEDDLDILELEIEALNTAASLDIDNAEAILRT